MQLICGILELYMKKDNTVKPEDIMTGYEIRSYRGYKKTTADQIVDKQMFSTAIKNRLAMEEQVRLPSGEVINVSALELLVDKKLQFDLNNPEEIDLVKWRKAAGEEVVQLDANLRGANELFGDIVNPKTEPKIREIQ